MALAFFNEELQSIKSQLQLSGFELFEREGEILIFRQVEDANIPFLFYRKKGGVIVAKTGNFPFFVDETSLQWEFLRIIKEAGLHPDKLFVKKKLIYEIGLDSP